MQQIRKRILYTLASAFGLSVLAVAPVWAQQGQDSGSDKSTEHSVVASTTEDNSNDSSSDSAATETEKETLREQARKLVTTKRETGKTHTAEQKKKSCEAHQTEINNRVDNYAKAAQRHLVVFNTIFTRVQAFQTDKQLNVPTYDGLVATAKTKQAAAQTAVDALQALNVKIDCTQADPATGVATVKTATANARTALQEYRKAIKDVIVALKGASTSTTKNSDSSTSGSSNTDTTGGNQ